MEHAPTPTGASQRRPDPVLYLIQGHSGGPVKIGTAKDPHARLAQLQTGQSERLRIVATAPGDHAEEAALHRQLQHRRIKGGEWFDLTDEEFAALIRHFSALKLAAEVEENAHDPYASLDEPSRLALTYWHPGMETSPSRKDRGSPLPVWSILGPLRTRRFRRDVNRLVQLRSAFRRGVISLEEFEDVALPVWARIAPQVEKLEEADREEEDRQQKARQKALDRQRAKLGVKTRKDRGVVKDDKPEEALANQEALTGLTEEYPSADEEGSGEQSPRVPPPPPPGR